MFCLHLTENGFDRDWNLFSTTGRPEDSRRSLHYQCHSID